MDRDRGALLSSAASVPLRRRRAPGALLARDVPFEQLSRCALPINRTTAKALGITIAPDLMLRAHEVIDQRNRRGNVHQEGKARKADANTAPPENAGT